VVVAMMHTQAVLMEVQEVHHGAQLFLQKSSVTSLHVLPSKSMTMTITMAMAMTRR